MDEYCPASRRGFLTSTPSHLGGRPEQRGLPSCPATAPSRYRRPPTATGFDLQAWEPTGREDDDDADDRDA